ncbi:DUF4336 domain-containing protein [Muricoccus radiodurans]|uniref:DUF4336 domain-containing protein n=1 Tax=Muricoccus radiodurans TaxID=2231721 RepID=UPI003CF610D8
MIPTRVHAAIDYGVSAALAGLSASHALPPAVRAALRAAGAYHTAYSLVTDYEGGVRPLIPMRQHLALDALGGVSLVAAGLLMGSEARGGRALLVGVGLTELAVVALSHDVPRVPASAPEGPGYVPLDMPKAVARNVFVVDSLMEGHGPRPTLPVRMTVFRLEEGGLLLHSPTRYSPELQQALQAIGPIQHLVAPNIAHWTFLKEWQRALPDATTWAAPGLRERGQVQRSGLRLDHDLGHAAPAEWGPEMEMVTVPGGLGFHECALFHRPSRTLVLTDLVLNLEPTKLPGLLRPMARLLGITAPDGRAPPYLRAVVKMRRAEAAEAASRLIALRPDRVIFAHGRPFEGDATGALRRSLRWLTG